LSIEVDPVKAAGTAATFVPIGAATIKAIRVACRGKCSAAVEAGIAKLGRALGRDSSAAKGALSVTDKAAQLRMRAPGDRVSIETSKGRMSVDLTGGTHFEKSLGRNVPTPHVKFETRHVGPNGRISYTSGPVREATQGDLRLVDRILTDRGF
jgi:hypothetical protein